MTLSTFQAEKFLLIISALFLQPCATKNGTADLLIYVTFGFTARERHAVKISWTLAWKQDSQPLPIKAFE
jgi:hypothetical protein